jgi:hypothetical protein
MGVGVGVCSTIVGVGAHDRNSNIVKYFIFYSPLYFFFE